MAAIALNTYPSLHAKRDWFSNQQSLVAADRVRNRRRLQLLQCSANRTSAITNGECAGNLSAVVIGGGIAGLLAAHVLARRVDRVMVIEKDEIGAARVEDETFKQTSIRRRGVPQITQPHQLISGAVSALNTLMPGFRDQVIAKGGLALDLGKDIHYYDYGAVFPQSPSPLQGLGVSRRFLEQCIRDRVTTDNADVVDIKEGRRAAAFKWEDKAVSGVVLDDGTEILADIVVDASGRRSQTPKWLEEAGFQSPGLIVVDPHVASASRMVAMPDGWNKAKLLICKTQPTGSKGATLLPTEGGLWQVTLAEVNGTFVPKTDEEFLQFAKDLPDQEIYQALLQSTAVTPVAAYLAMKNELLCYHEISMPSGVVVLGDAVQRHNAVYGQGIAAAAHGIIAFEQHLAQEVDVCQTSSSRRNALTRISQDFQPLLTQRLRPFWDMATKSDLRYPGTTVHGNAHKPSKLQNFITDCLLRAAQQDSYIYQQVLSVAHMTTPQNDLLRDIRVLRGILGCALSSIGPHKR